jgi:NhaP-type Na+/H+ or K+/H+ antiporter
VSLVIFLPALLFEGSLKIQFRHLRENIVPISLLATVGVLAATLISGFSLHWALGIPILIALVFGAIVAATDPISILSIFKDMAVDKRLAIVVEGESLFNDGTAVVLYGILFGAVASSHFAIVTGIRDFVVEVAGGAAVGAALGYIFSKLTQKIEDPEIGDYAYHHLGIRFLPSRAIAAFIGGHCHRGRRFDDWQFWRAHRDEFAHTHCVVVVLGVCVISYQLDTISDHWTSSASG